MATWEFNFGVLILFFSCWRTSPEFEMGNVIAIVYIYIIKYYLDEKLNNFEYKIEVLTYRKNNRKLLFEFKSEP